MESLRARVRTAYRRIAEVDRPEVWIDLRPEPELLDEAVEIAARLRAGEALPLAGKLVAVKGNIDVAGLPTTAGCPAYAYRPAADAPAVARLRAAGALVLGTTNLDQFATGLVGTRSPHGAVRNAVDPDRISGGSSSGSAVAVALGIADLALGTDTAGSGRVPAALNGIVGLKPTNGLISTEGVVPACASIDCVTVFARTVGEAHRALDVLAPPVPASTPAAPHRIGVPAPEDLGRLAPGWAEAFADVSERFRASGAELVHVDLTPFLRAAELLYQGAFVAERYAAVGEFVDAHRDEVDPVVGEIISAAGQIPAHRAFTDQRRLAELAAEAEVQLRGVDALLLPTTTGHPTIAEVAADPVGVNSALGRFTNFANLLGLAALAIPAGRVGGLPFGVTLVGAAHQDRALAHVADLLAETEPVLLAVAGAHLSGQPLNHQLTDRNARLVRTTTTAPVYRLHALRTTPPKPGLVRAEAGKAVEVEVWELTASAFGSFVAALPAPMTIGAVELSDGSTVRGFLCEPAALHDAEDITHHGGWRNYLAER
ncbi:allophanate hydrolase [Saccharopolyspora flava]|uniref:allophanate hydrolase n=1 Tax=Saccharopolyspora flava TaxID=95161 RepID=UPI000B8197C9|nr:allophanate hydrolase [Saccharopolyspora flava]